MYFNFNRKKAIKKIIIYYVYYILKNFYLDTSKIV